ncbi:hypothetical protein Q1695_001679 [Nippostrongylus brasiliensis]|nr:hypothetical protein Q1695_001679 [Nippostrongylus brasiliensis]
MGNDFMYKAHMWFARLERWSDDQWACGADRIWPSKFTSKAAAIRKCPSVLDELNNACRIHDSCYSEGIEGQAACDNRFCESLSAIKFSNDKERSQCTLTQAMCKITRMAGSLIYRDKLTTPTPP